MPPRVLEKAEEDNRTYKYVEIGSNCDLPCILVSDMESDTSAVAVTAFSGTNVDPIEHPGMMHLIEHSLFLGNEKYPAENLFREFLSQHNGHSNAYTAHDHTCYFFEVDTKYLDSALDQFARFFIDPLFEKDVVLREVDAVDSEHDKNKQSDVWRFEELYCSNANPAHPYSKFGTGTRDTLKHDHVPSVAERYFSKHYCSKNMCVCIIGNKPLAELEDLASRNFLDFSRTGSVELDYKDIPVVTEKEYGLEFYIVPVAELNNVNVYWYLPSLLDKWKGKPDSYVAHLVGHESEGSILYILKEKGWATQLYAGTMLASKTFNRFDVDITLTESGWEHREEVVDLVFSYIGYLKEYGITDRLYDEVSRLADMKFRFKTKEGTLSYSQILCSNFKNYPLEKLLSGMVRYFEFDKDGIRKVLDDLTARRANVSFISRYAKEMVNRTEKWYGTEYSVSSVEPSKILRRAELAKDDNIRLPAENPFIPGNFDVLTKSKAETPSMPRLIFEDKTLEAWHKLDDTFLKPKANIYICLDSVYTYSSPKNAVLNTLLSEMLIQVTNNIAYQADCAGLTFKCSGDVGCLNMIFGGYTDKMFTLIREVFSRLSSFSESLTEVAFSSIREQLEKKYANFKFWQPYQLCHYYLMRLLRNPSWHIEDLHRCVKDITLEDVSRFVPELLSTSHTSVLVHGNLPESSVKELRHLFLEFVQKTEPRPFDGIILRRRSTVVPVTNFVYRLPCPNEENVNSNTTVYIQYGHLSICERLLLEIMCQIISDIAFDMLRNIEQLGYIVVCKAIRTNKIDGLMVFVQSSVASSNHLNSRIQAFLDSIEDKIKTLTEEQFNVHREGLITVKSERFTKLNSESHFLWEQISSESYFFSKKQKQIEFLHSLKKIELVEFYNKFMKREVCRRVSVQIDSQKLSEKENLLDEQIDIDEVEIKSLYEFKEAHGLYPCRWPEEVDRLQMEREKLINATINSK